MATPDAAVGPGSEGLPAGFPLPSAGVDLSGYRVALLGGDPRERLLLVSLVQAGAAVIAVGWPAPGTHPFLSGLEALLQAGPGVVTFTSDAREAVRNAQAVVAPMSNTDAAGRVVAVPDGVTEIFLTEKLLSYFPPGITLYLGQAKPVVRRAADKARVRIVELGEVDQIAWANAVPTAEGAIALAMQNTPITLRGARSVIIGAGRCGTVLAADLAGLGAQVTVAARRAAARARIAAAVPGCRAVPMEELAAVLSSADVVFNTVPAPVLPEPLLQRLPPAAVIVDVAAVPGGVDWEAAARLKRRALFAPGLPGKVAPVTAGRALAEAVPRLLAEERAGRAEGTKP